MQSQTYNTVSQGSITTSALLIVIAVFMLFAGLLFSATILAFSTILAPLIWLRILWLKRCYRDNVKSNFSHSNSHKSSVIEAEYFVVNNKRSN